MYAIINYKENKKVFVTYFTTQKSAENELKRPFTKYADYREMRYKDLFENSLGFSKYELEDVETWKIIKTNKDGK